MRVYMIELLAFIAARILILSDMRDAVMSAAMVTPLLSTARYFHCGTCRAHFRQATSPGHIVEEESDIARRAASTDTRNIVSGLQQCCVAYGGLTLAAGIRKWQQARYRLE